MDFAFVSRFRSAHTIGWALLLACLIVAVAATIGRAALHLNGALTDDDASLAVMMLLPQKKISDVTMIKASSDTQEFLAETNTGPELIRAKRGPLKWFIEDEVPLHR